MLRRCKDVLHLTSMVTHVDVYNNSQTDIPVKAGRNISSQVLDIIVIAIHWFYLIIVPLRRCSRLDLMGRRQLSISAYKLLYNNTFLYIHRPGAKLSHQWHRAGVLVFHQFIHFLITAYFDVNNKNWYYIYRFCSMWGDDGDRMYMEEGLLTALAFLLLPSQLIGAGLALSPPPEEACRCRLMRKAIRGEAWAGLDHRVSTLARGSRWDYTPLPF